MASGERLRADTATLPALTIFRDRFVFAPNSGLFFGVSAEGAWILKRLSAGESESEIVAGLMRKFGIHRGTAQRDLEQFVQRLRQLGLLAVQAEADL